MRHLRLDRRSHLARAFAALSPARRRSAIAEIALPYFSANSSWLSPSASRVASCGHRGRPWPQPMHWRRARRGGRWLVFSRCQACGRHRDGHHPALIFSVILRQRLISSRLLFSRNPYICWLSHSFDFLKISIETKNSIRALHHGPITADGHRRRLGAVDPVAALAFVKLLLPALSVSQATFAKFSAAPRHVSACGQRSRVPNP